ncbi:exopolyphosphatase/guanosine-5'-triphosphate,3'-diphosphate pyrophosphatase [Allocatelliglobosispora scoriae]|uniref:Exopolyphosphatase/guanosine-5'-triphosphate, 3'-diphosphate pyrophosphatase n=1 Tax=Allocatelliglobosispora scoriae TaxID=643052 RepID=A0A841BWB1_9ACTN|nr:Ppx/GppA phosphatase family protein [Allocatelliglobosispora scoriae]MBB5871439.1 exopolyphosphatase/guanosine-5'-triphosphate,3'-diphosphate pyrophosphatase [Allocatelliglobosispora scoriae]
MRLGVLDVGSNTVHLLIVDAYPGAHPWPAHSEKSMLRLAEQLGPDGALTKAGETSLVEAVGAARESATRLGVDELLAFATSAVRDATNSSEVLTRVREATGVSLRVLPGADEARLTFLAVRRWFGWSAGRLLVLDIGGGSLEIACGIDEEPGLAISLPLGAGRLTRDRLRGDPPTAANIAELRDYTMSHLTKTDFSVVEGWDRAAATSKTFRSLARLAGAAPSGKGLWAPRILTRTALSQVLSFISRIPSDSLAELDGVSPQRSHQLLAGAVVAHATMTHLGVDVVHICPWALREGLILEHMR